MTFTHALSTNNYGTAKFIVSANAYEGTHTTIAAALTSASSGDTIFIRPGTYTENLTLKAGVNLAAYNADALTPNVSIVGKATFTAAGTVSISGIRFTTNSDFFLAVTGSLASIVNLDNCYLNCSNNTGISFTTSSPSGAINCNYCTGDIGTTGIGVATSSSAGTITFNYCNITNSGSSTTVTTCSAGSITFNYTQFNSPISCTSTGNIGGYSSYFSCTALNTTAATFAGSATNVFTYSSFSSGSASACTVTTNAELEYCKITSSNTNALTGAGTLTYDTISFDGTSSVMNVTTQLPLYSNLGKYKASGQPCLIAYKSSGSTNVTGDGTNYTVVFDTVVKDQASNYNNGTGTFTFPVTGIYAISCQVLLQNASATFNGSMAFNLTAGTQNSYTQAVLVTGNNQMTGLQLYSATAGNTLTVSAISGGGTKIVGVYGGTDYRTSLHVWQIT